MLRAQNLQDRSMAAAAASDKQAKQFGAGAGDIGSKAHGPGGKKDSFDTFNPVTWERAVGAHSHARMPDALEREFRRHSQAMRDDARRRG